MNKLVVALSLGYLAVCARAEAFDDVTQLQLAGAPHQIVFPGFAEEADSEGRNGYPPLYVVVPELNNPQKNNYTLLLGSWPRTFTLEDIHAHNDNSFYAIAEKKLGRNLIIYMRVEQADASHLQSGDYFPGAEALGSNENPEYVLGFLLNNSWQPGDGLAIAIAHTPNLRSVTFSYPNEEYVATFGGLSYFLPLVKSLKAHTSVYYHLDPKEEINLNEALTAELRLNFKF